MTAPPVTADVTATAFEVALRMEEEGVDCVLVTDSGRLQGIVTDRDLAVRGLAHGKHLGRPVAELLTTPVITVNTTDDLDTVYRTFRRTFVRRLPVVQDGRPVGVLTVDDLLRDIVERLFDLVTPFSHSTLREYAVRPAGTGADPPTTRARHRPPAGHHLVDQDVDGTVEAARGS
ncbi:cyclic nucleotide-binding/CBS domain-containing protein [Kitasatospora sp. NPDC004745]|uniref:CBS domain-containing protein n=1 Tax=unclassified Kitasatospora TaxID=2633591 RepID=UPI0033CE897E